MVQQEIIEDTDLQNYTLAEIPPSGIVLTEDKMKKKEITAVSKHVLEAAMETTRLLIEQESEHIAEIVDLCLVAYEAGNQFIFIGNGGNSANAAHFAADFTKRPILDIDSAKRVSTRSLVDSPASITMVGNDLGFEDIFLFQMMAAQVRPGDVIFAFSGSGNSPNVVKAVEYAKEEGGIIVSVTGFDGGKLGKMANINVTIPPDPARYLETDDHGAVMGLAEVETDLVLHSIIEAFREGVKYSASKPRSQTNPVSAE